MSKQGAFLHAIRIAVGAGCLILAAAGYVLYQRTIVVWWLPLVAAAAIALLTLPMLSPRWRWLTRSENGRINGLCHFSIVCVLFYFGLLGGNYWLADPASACSETAVVSGRIERTRKEYRYVRRHRRVPTGKIIRTYYLEIVFPDSTRKKLPVPGALYKKTRTNPEIVLSLQRGFFGYRVVKDRPKVSAK
ncbi:MAG: hypothetical protein K2O63_05760 [Alistipes sp.]|nr:hypothetical protein [Alistipes sp.]